MRISEQHKLLIIKNTKMFYPLYSQLLSSNHIKIIK